MYPYVLRKRDRLAKKKQIDGGTGTQMLRQFITLMKVNLTTCMRLCNAIKYHGKIDKVRSNTSA